MVCCCYCIILRGRMQCGDDLEWPPLVLWPCSAEELFYISRLSRSAERSKRIFTGGVVKANDICSAAFCESAALRGTNPLRHRCAMPPPPKGGGFALLIGRWQKAPPSGELANAVSLRGFSPLKFCKNPYPQRRACTASGAATVVSRHDPSRENAFGALRRARQTRNIK